MGNKGFNQSEFKRLLKKGIGTRTQKEFADVTGVTPITINRMLNDEKISCPKASTLEIFAKHMSSVTLRQLFDACGYDYPCITDKVREKELDILDFLSATNSNFIAYDNMESFKTVLGNKYGKVRIAYTDTELTDSVNAAEYYAIVHIVWSYDIYCCETQFKIFYFKTSKDNKIVIVANDIGIEPDYIKKSSDNTVQNHTVIIDTKTLTSIKETNHTMEERLLRAIFGELDSDRVTVTYAGVGFYVDETPAGFIDFLNAHADTFCRTKENSKLYRSALEPKADVDKIFSDFRDNGGARGPLAVISYIMSKETNKDYMYWDESDESPCIMYRYPNDIVDDINITELRYLHDCAKTLQIEEFGTVYTTFSILKEGKTYKTNDVYFS